MKLIERSLVGAQDSTMPFLDRIQGIWKFGLTWDRDAQAQKVLIDELSNALDNSYTLISNVPLPGFSVPVPAVLIGKTGLRTFCVSGDTGIFSLKGEQWYKLDEQKEQYRPSRPNLVRRTALMSRAIIEYLKEKGIFVDEYEPILYFAHPEVQIDAEGAPVNMLERNEIERFAAELVSERTVLDAMELQRITEILVQSRPKAAKKKQELPSRSTLSGNVGFGDFRLKAWQWLILFLLAILMLVTVIVTAVIILNTA